MKRWLFFVLSLPMILTGEIIWKSGTSEDFEVAIRISPEKIEQGQSFDVFIEVFYPSNYEFNSNALIEQVWNTNSFYSPLAMKHSEIQKIIVDDKQIKQRIKLIVEPTESGPIPFSLLLMSFIPTKETFPPVNILTPIFTIDATPFTNFSISPLASLIQLEPKFPMSLTEVNRNLVDGPLALKKEQQKTRQLLDNHQFPWKIVLILICFAAMTWLIYVMKQKGSKFFLKKRAVLVTPKDSIDVLLNLEKKNLLHPEGYPSYLNETYDMLLYCLKNQLKFEAKTMTVNEMINQLKEGDMPLTRQKEIQDLLFKIEEMKFTNRSVSVAEMTSLIRSTQNLINSLNSLSH